MPEKKTEKSKLSWTAVWEESRELLWARRGRLTLGFGLLLVSRLAGMVLPASTKILIDEVIGNQRSDLLVWIALAGGLAYFIQAGTGFALTVILGVLIAVLINKAFPGRGIVRVLLISPFFIMPAVNAVLWINMILDPVLGLQGIAISEINSLSAGLKEAPGREIIYEGRIFKAYRGMGSIGAIKQGSGDRYQRSENEEPVPEGIEGRVPYKGELKPYLHQLVTGLRKGMGYCGCKTIDDFHLSLGADLTGVALATGFVGEEMGDTFEHGFHVNRSVENHDNARTEGGVNLS